MNFELSEDIQLLKKGIRDFIDNEVDPYARITKIQEGTSEIQKNIIASQLHKEYEKGGVTHGI